VREPPGKRDAFGLLAVFDSARIPVAEWKDIPTVKEALGIDVHYLMLRGIFGAPGMPKEAVDGIRASSEGDRDAGRKKYMEAGALKPPSRSSRVRQVVEETALPSRSLDGSGGSLDPT